MNLRNYINIGGYARSLVLFETIVIQIRRRRSLFGRVFHSKSFISVLFSDSADARFVFGGEGLEQAVFHNIVEIAQNTDVIRYTIVVQTVEKRPAREMSWQAAKHKRYIWAENRRKERGDSRFAFHLASFLRFMAANLSLTHLETWARPL